MNSTATNPADALAPRSDTDITTIIATVAETGGGVVKEDIVPLLHTELCRLAAAKTPRGSGGTLQPAALVHETWLRLLGTDGWKQFQNRAHFFSSAAEAMRRILIEHACRRATQECDANEIQIATPTANDSELLAVHETLDRLAAYDPRKAVLVKLCYFTGFTIEEAAALLEIPEPDAKRDWQFARAWLARETRR